MFALQSLILVRFDSWMNYTSYLPFRRPGCVRMLENEFLSSKSMTIVRQHLRLGERNEHRRFYFYS